MTDEQPLSFSPGDFYAAWLPVSTPSPGKVKPLLRQKVPYAGPHKSMWTWSRRRQIATPWICSGIGDAEQKTPISSIKSEIVIFNDNMMRRCWILLDFGVSAEFLEPIQSTKSSSTVSQKSSSVMSQESCPSVCYCNQCQCIQIHVYIYNYIYILNK